MGETLMTLEALEEFLHSGGVNSNLFNKSIGDLHREISEGECTIVSKDGRVATVRITVAVCISSEVVEGDRTRRFELREIRRTFQNGVVVNRIKEWSVSETRKRDEEIIDAALRGLREELGIKVCREDFDLPKWILFQDYVDRESDAYPGIRSYAMVQRLGITLCMLPPQAEIHVENDNGTKIDLVWIEVQ